MRPPKEMPQRLWLTPMGTAGPPEYYRQQGTDICLNCPVDPKHCSEVHSSSPQATRLRATKPTCPMAVAIWLGYPVPAAEVIARRTLNPDDHLSAKWYERTIRQCLAEPTAQLDTNKEKPNGEQHHQSNGR